MNKRYVTTLTTITMNLRTGKCTDEKEQKGIDKEIKEEKPRELTEEDQQFIVFMKKIMLEFEELTDAPPVSRIVCMIQIYKYFDEKVHIIKIRENLARSVRDKTINLSAELGQIIFKNGDDAKLLSFAIELSSRMLTVLAKLGNIS